MPESSRTVMVVDDADDLREVLALALRQAGYHVIVARDGVDALEAIARQMPALILLDMRMPGMDGRTFIREFRVRYSRATPIVIITAGQDACRQARELGTEGYLGKPFRIGRLIRLVESFVGP